jgi:hypothetical protein
MKNKYPSVVHQVCGILSSPEDLHICRKIVVMISPSPADSYINLLTNVRVRWTRGTLFNYFLQMYESSGLKLISNFFNAPPQYFQSSTTQVSFDPPPCDELTIKEPSRKATRVNPPGTTSMPFGPHKAYGRKSTWRG